MREEDRDEPEHDVFDHAAPVGPLAVELHLPPAVPLDQPLDRSVDELHVDGLRTGPAAPDASQDGRDQEDPDEEPDEQEHQEHRVGRKKRRTEQRELPVREVEQDQRLSAHLQVRDRREGDDQGPADDEAPLPPRSARDLRADPAPRSVLVQGRQDPFGHFTLSALNSSPWGAFGFGGFEPCKVPTYAESARIWPAGSCAFHEIIPLRRDALGDGVVDLRRLSAVEPVVVRDVRADVPLAGRTVADRAPLREQPLRRGHHVGLGRKAGDHLIVDRPELQKLLRLEVVQREHLAIVLLRHGFSVAELVVEEVPDRKEDRGPKQEQPPTRERIVVLPDPVVLVLEDRVLLTHGSLSSRPLGAGRQGARCARARRWRGFFA